MGYPALQPPSVAQVNPLQGSTPQEQALVGSTYRPPRGIPLGKNSK
jgi:hypothetical protein